MPGIIGVMIMYPSRWARARSVAYFAVAAWAASSCWANALLTVVPVDPPCDEVLGAAGAVGVSEPQAAVAATTRTAVRTAIRNRSMMILPIGDAPLNGRRDHARAHPRRPPMLPRRHPHF